MTALEFIEGHRVFPDELESLLKAYAGKNVLITGAVGSIGTALSHVLLESSAKIYAVDHNEGEVALAPWCSVGDFVDYPVTEMDYVFHTAAYKHVVLGEQCKAAFIENNVVKTKLLLERALAAKVVMISTDKACGLSFMGQTKRMAEVDCAQARQTAIRLVNVARSKGSVLWHWERTSRAKCAPRNTQRYWMQQMDAVQAILKVGLMDPGIYTVDQVPSFLLGEFADIYESRGVTFEEMPLRTGEVKDERLYDSFWESLVPTECDYLKRITKR